VDEYKSIKFGEDWRLFCNGRQLYEGKGIRFGRSGMGYNGMLYCTFMK
jgi:hypothetical protein